MYATTSAKVWPSNIRVSGIYLLQKTQAHIAALHEEINALQIKLGYQH